MFTRVGRKEFSVETLLVISCNFLCMVASFGPYRYDAIAHEPSHPLAKRSLDSIGKVLNRPSTRNDAYTDLSEGS